jgi:hypothetical protein
MKLGMTVLAKASGNLTNRPTPEFSSGVIATAGYRATTSEEYNRAKQRVLQ